MAMKATDLLKKQHKDVKGLFKKVEKARGGEERRRLMEQIAEHLRLHTSLEEELFYPAVHEVNRKAAEMVDVSLEEHHVVDLVLEDLPNVDPEDERFHAKMTVLMELVEHHVKEEESEMFKLAEKLGKERLTELGEQLAQRAGMPAPGRQRRAA